MLHNYRLLIVIVTLCLLITRVGVETQTLRFNNWNDSGISGDEK